MVYKRADSLRSEPCEAGFHAKREQTGDNAFNNITLRPEGPHPQKQAKPSKVKQAAGENIFKS